MAQAAGVAVGVAAGTAVAARIASAVAIAHNSVSEARAEALNEPNEHLRNEKENLLDNVDHGISTFEKAYAIGQKSQGILANDSLEASTASEMRDIMELASSMVNSQIENVQKNVKRIKEIEPGALGFVIPDDPYDFLSIEYSDDNNNDKDKEDNNVNENKSDEKEEKMGQLLNNNNENDNNKQGMMMMMIGEKDDYVSDSDSNHNGNNNDEMLKDNNNNNNNVNGKKKNKKRRVIVYYKDEGKLRKTPQYSKFAVILSAFFYAGFVILKQLKKA